MQVPLEDWQQVIVKVMSGFQWLKLFLPKTNFPILKMLFLNQCTLETQPNVFWKMSLVKILLMKLNMDLEKIMTKKIQVMEILVLHLKMMELMLVMRNPMKILLQTKLLLMMEIKIMLIIVVKKN